MSTNENQPLNNTLSKKKGHIPTKINQKETQPNGATADQLNQFKKTLAEKEKEVKELYDRLLRNQAELENYRKRAAKDKTETIKFATENLIHDLLPVMDDFQRAIEAGDSTTDPKVLQEGTKLIFNQLQAVLSKAGLEGVNAVGEKFDPTKHEAVRVIESHEHEDSTVLEEMRKGYTLNKRILRPSMVAVAKAKDSGSEDKTNRTN